jgi:hypothetical protein
VSYNTIVLEDGQVDQLIEAISPIGGLRLPKVLKNMINIVFQVKYMYRNLRTWNEVVHNMESMIGTKVKSISKLCEGSFGSVVEKGIDLKRKRIFSPL